MKAFLKTLLQFLFPQPKICLICHKALPEVGICYRCYQELELRVQALGYCERCHTFGYNTKTCDNCRLWPRYFKENRSLWPYEGGPRDCVQHFKFHHEPWRGKALGQLMEAQAPHDYEAIIPVPLHKRRLQSRGYNQSLLLAQGLSEALHCPVYADVLQRQRHTPHQTGLSREARKANLNAAFRVRHPEKIKGKKLILVDDVMTTGITLKMCAKTLHQAGAKEITALTLCNGIA